MRLHFVCSIKFINYITAALSKISVLIINH